eukprot:423774_1
MQLVIIQCLICTIQSAFNSSEWKGGWSFETDNTIIVHQSGAGNIFGMDRKQWYHGNNPLIVEFDISIDFSGYSAGDDAGITIFNGRSASTCEWYNIGIGKYGINMHKLHLVRFPISSQQQGYIELVNATIPFAGDVFSPMCINITITSNNNYHFAISITNKLEISFEDIGGYDPLSNGLSGYIGFWSELDIVAKYKDLQMNGTPRNVDPIQTILSPDFSNTGDCLTVTAYPTSSTITIATDAPTQQSTATPTTNPSVKPPASQPPTVPTHSPTLIPSRNPTHVPIDSPLSSTVIPSGNPLATDPTTTTETFTVSATTDPPSRVSKDLVLTVSTSQINEIRSTLESEDNVTANDEPDMDSMVIIAISGAIVFVCVCILICLCCKERIPKRKMEQENENLRNIVQEQENNIVNIPADAHECTVRNAKQGEGSVSLADDLPITEEGQRHLSIEHEAQAHPRRTNTSNCGRRTKISQGKDIQVSTDTKCTSRHPNIAPDEFVIGS